MYPGRAAVAHRSVMAWTAGDKIIEPKVAEFMAGIGSEDDRYGRRRGEQCSQRFEPRNETPAAFRRRLPPGAARRHDDEGWTAVAGEARHDIAGTRRSAPAVGDEPSRSTLSGGREHRCPGFGRDMNG